MSTEESPAQWVFVPTLVTGNPEIDAAGAVVTAFEKLLIAGKGDAAFTRYATPDMILVEAPGLPYTKSVYAAGPEFLSFFAEYLELVKVAKPVMQVFPITSERCITKVFDAHSTLRATGESWPIDVLEEAWLRDNKIYKIKPYYFNQLPLIKSHMNAKSQSQDVREHWKFKEDEEVPKKEQIQAKGLQNAP